MAVIHRTPLDIREEKLAKRRERQRLLHPQTTRDKVKSDRTSLNRTIVQLGIIIAAWLASVWLAANVLEAVRAGRVPWPW